MENIPDPKYKIGDVVIVNNRNLGTKFYQLQIQKVAYKRIFESDKPCWVYSGDEEYATEDEIIKKLN